MQAWWRVLSGVKPYWKSALISIICALGVGLSYAAGVGVMLPVMKIFISAEGVHGWADRTIVDKRLDVTIQDLDTTFKNFEARKAATSQPATATYGVVITTPGKNNPNKLEGGMQIMSVRIDGAAPVDGWTKMVRAISHAPTGASIELSLADGRVIPVTSSEIPWYMAGFRWAVDLLPSEGKYAATFSLIYVMIFFVFLCLIGSIFRYYQQFIGMNIACRVVMDIRRTMYDRVVQLPTSYFAQKGTADVMSRLAQDTNILTEGVSMALGKAIQEPVKAMFAFGLALWLDWKLCGLVVLSVPLLAIVIHKFSKRMRRAGRRALESRAQMLAIINETLIGGRVVKAYTAEGYERRRFAHISKKLLGEQNRINHYGALSRPVVETLAVILSAIPMVFAAHLVLTQHFDKETFFTLLVCFAAMLEPMRKLSDVNSKVQQSNAAGQRVFEVIDMETEPNISYDLPKLPRHTRSIEFKNITFSYPGHSEIVLDNVSFSIRAGQTVAVVGGNGSGKTTLLNLLPRLYVPTAGQILVDGVDAAGVTVKSLRKQIGLVTQDTLLFADTIYNNIAYGARHATKEQVLEAARRAFADEFITGLPQGYETRVGEHGVRLSGGQKQRIAIARAILRDPSILILDEAMSQIDSESETKISDALRAFTHNRTTFMIAHRFQSVISANVIICLDAGKVVGVGTHSQLVETCPQYRKLYETQSFDSPAA
jgi:ABC-type multidrug transport system fused ATPase/permease subunit